MPTVSFQWSKIKNYIFKSYIHQHYMTVLAPTEPITFGDLKLTVLVEGFMVFFL